jgi:hypothetical protein
VRRLPAALREQVAHLIPAEGQSITAIPSRTFQIVRIESCVIENAATLLVGAYLLSVATSSGWVWPAPPGVIAKIPESMCDEATRKTVNAVTGRSTRP